MTDTPNTTSQPSSAIPADDPNRKLTIADPDGAGMRHISVVGDTYTILVSGAQTAGRYCLVDMLVPDGSGPPPHRHDFEEMFTLLEGELEFIFRGNKTTLKAGETINIPANAPHVFKNKSGKTVRMLCMCTPAGQDEFFMEVGEACRGQNVPGPQARQGRRGRVHKESYSTRAKVSNGASQAIMFQNLSQRP